MAWRALKRLCGPRRRPLADIHASVGDAYTIACPFLDVSTLGRLVAVGGPFRAVLGSQVYARVLAEYRVIYDEQVAWREEAEEATAELYLDLARQRGHWGTDSSPGTSYHSEGEW